MIQEVPIEKKMQEAYLNYSLSVIISRALPDVRDGLKPVHRRILYAAIDLGLTPDKPHKKAARIVGEVLGKYHPHGDSAVYEAMVRMAQDFSQRYLLMDGHGNFGSIDGDSPAAMRYTEARLTPLALELLQDMHKETVPFVDNFDGSLKEPEVLPAKIPNLLINGSSGIAVGMSTSIPPHNLKEIIQGTIYLLENPQGSLKELMKIIKGPDFPTGGIIIGEEGIREAYGTGKGRIVLRAKTEVEKTKGKEQIIIKEIPYQVNKARLLEEMDQVVKKNRVEHVSSIRDESDRDGLRIVIELKGRANTQIVLNNLLKYTSLQIGYRLNFLTLVDKQPVILNLKELLAHFIAFRKDVITKRSQYQLLQLEEKIHILQGLKKALDEIDLVIKMIRSSPNREKAKEKLEKVLGMTELQAQEILKMRLQSLVGLERKKILLEMEQIEKEINFLRGLLGDPRLLSEEIKKELEVLKKSFRDKRRTKIQGEEEEAHFQKKDLIKKEGLYISLSYRYYVKRSLEEEHLKAGKKDFLTHIFSGTTRDTLLFFTNDGYVHVLPCSEIPEHHNLSTGDPLSAYLKIDQRNLIGTLLLREEEDDKIVTIATKYGYIKRTPCMEYRSYYTSIKAIKLEEGDEVVDIALTDGNQRLFLATTAGQSILFKEDEVSITGRNTRGSRGIKLQGDDKLLSMATVGEENEVVVFHEEGRGCRTPLSAFKEQRRNGKGVKLIHPSEKAFVVLTLLKGEDLLLVTTEGDFYPLKVSELHPADGLGHLYELSRVKGKTLTAVIPLPRSKELDYGPE